MYSGTAFSSESPRRASGFSTSSGHTHTPRSVTMREFEHISRSRSKPLSISSVRKAASSASSGDRSSSRPRVAGGCERPSESGKGLEFLRLAPSPYDGYQRQKAALAQACCRSESLTKHAHPSNRVVHRLSVTIKADSDFE